MSATDVAAIVVGGGVAGLAAGLELQSAFGEVVVIDASDRPGGVMRTDHVSGFVIERGPSTVQVKAPMLRFLKKLGLEGALLKAQPAGRQRYVFHDRGLVQVPTSPLGLLRTPLLSKAGKLRMLAEPLIPRGDPSSETVARYVGRRLGSEVVSRLVGPFLTGVYAGDEDRLGATAVFPSLTRHRSMAVGLLAQGLGRLRRRGLRGSYSSVGGLGPFARTLAERLVEPPALRTRATALWREGSSWHVELSGPGGGRALSSPRVVVATPAAEASQLLRSASPEVAQALAGIEYAPIVGVPLGVEPAAVRTPIEGFGFLVGRDAGLQLLGCLFMSRLFENRAPEGREQLHCMLGGVRWPEAIDTPDDVLVERLYQDLDRTLGLRGEPKALAVTRWERAVAQPGCDHLKRLAAVGMRLREMPGLALAGGYLHGVSVGDALVSGVRAARAVSG